MFQLKITTKHIDSITGIEFLTSAESASWNVHLIAKNSLAYILPVEAMNCQHSMSIQTPSKKVKFWQTLSYIKIENKDL